MAMDDDAFKKAVLKFYEGANFPEYEKATGKAIRHNKAHFDDMEKTIRRKVGARNRYKATETVEEEI